MFTCRSAKCLIMSAVFHLFSVCVYPGTTGKIAGTVSDTETGEPLAGVNVYLVGTTSGAASDENGHYNILNIQPGIKTVEISMIGYEVVRITEVRVISDQTTRLNVGLQSETMGTEAIVIVADREIIKPDVSASRTSITSDEIDALPQVSVEDVVQMQAGVEDGLSIRGGGADEALFLFDGFAMRDPRNNQPVTQLFPEPVE